ncbi:MAG TPA: DUF192 domain-containing protein [Chloroflexota bacterium]|nr:DUF192 domain-containing protein [Chloroflexota bacterium]
MANDTRTFLRATNGDQGTVLAERVTSANSFFARFRGLMLAETLPVGDGLLLAGDNSIHTFFMRFPIDVVFLDRQQRVVHLMHRVAPWRVSKIVWRARAVLELPPGTLAATNTRVGDLVKLERGEGPDLTP